MFHIVMFASAAWPLWPADPASICKEPPSLSWLPVGGRWGCSGAPHGAGCTASCDAGYDVNGTLTVQCNLGACSCHPTAANAHGFSFAQDCNGLNTVMLCLFSAVGRMVFEVHVACLRTGLC
jgi:hypothetical protein